MAIKTKGTNYFFCILLYIMTVTLKNCLLFPSCTWPHVPYLKPCRRSVLRFILQTVTKTNTELLHNTSLT